MSDLTGAQKRALEASGCEVRTDMLTCCLYAVDASIYRVEPAAVAFPRSAVEAANVLRVAAENGVEITPRGAGTGLVGGALGSGLVVDFARYNSRMSDCERDLQTVLVGAGVNVGVWLGVADCTAAVWLIAAIAVSTTWVTA